MTPALEPYCQGTRAGTVRIEYVLLKDVDPDSISAIVDPTWERRNPVLLLDGDWQTMPTLPDPTWRETEQKADQGSRYRHEVSLRTRQLSAGASGIFNALSRHRLLLRITDGEERKWVLGNKDQGFRMSYHRSAGGVGSFAGYDVRLSGDFIHSVAGWNPF